MAMTRYVPLVALILAAPVNCQLKNQGLAVSEPAVIAIDAAVVITGGSAGTSTGGIIGNAGGSSTAGAIASGGNTLGAGGVEASEGSVIDSGTTASGGAVSTGGAAVPAGQIAAGGAVATGGVPSAGGVVAFGGTTATGGIVIGGEAGAGGASSPDALNPPDAPADERVADDASFSVDTASAGLQMLWSDEFDSTTISGVNTSKWSYVTWDPGQVNNEAQKYTNRLDNVFQDGNGHLVIRALNTPYSGAQYTSGRIETKGKFSFKYGRIEVRAKLPAGLGSFPGIVLLGTTGNWPQCGELALMEQYGQDKATVYSSAYTGSGAASGEIGPVPYDFDDDTTASKDFHVYSLDWQPDGIAFLVDGNEVTRTTFGSSSPFYSIPEYIVLDVALGGNMGGPIKNSQFPMEMVVDYVRVYSSQ